MEEERDRDEIQEEGEGAFGADGEMPIDQRPDDGRSLTFDTAPLEDRFEVLGAPAVTLEIACDRPAAMIAWLLNDVAPDGASTLVTYGVLNLSHRDGHAAPAPLEPGRRYAVSVQLNDIAHAFPAGHRIRIALSSTYPPAADIVSSVALTFFAYLGFTVISFTGDDLPDPKRNLPRAMYLALAITTALYILIALGVFGTLTVQEVIDNGETALAVAAKPALGQAGFAIMAIAALLATSSSVNANLYAATGSTAKLAQSGLFPPVFGQAARVGSTRGLVISTLLVLLLANLVDLTAIASLGSVVALVIFLVTSIAAMRLRAETGSNKWVLVAGITLTAVVLVVFAVQTLRTAPETFTAMIAVLLLAIVLNLVWGRIRGRRAASQAPDRPAA